MIKRIIIIAINVLCLIAFIICLSVSASIRTQLRSQQAASAWAGQSGERFSQISVFFPESFGFNEDAVQSLRHTLDDALLDASLESTPGRKLYTDAWSTEIDVSIVGERGQASVRAIAVGGDFFFFHPLYIRDGSYLSPNDVMKDRVVIDEELAWRLFGATRVSGFDIIIDNRPFVIAGVVSRESDFASLKAYMYGILSRESDFSGSYASTHSAGLFMSFEALSEMTAGEITDEEADEGAIISNYEIVMPNPVTGFALNALTEAIPETEIHVVENSTRFSLSNLFSVIGSFGERSMRPGAISFPYWENAARFAEDWLALLLLLSLIFIAFPIVCAVFYGIKIIRLLLKQGKRTTKKVMDDIENRKYEKYKLEHGEDGEAYGTDTEYDDIIY